MSGQRSATNAPIPPAATISPTDIAQFARLEQCQRYLALRLRERREGSGFLFDYGVRAQAIPTLLTRSGDEFEHRVEAAVAAHYDTHHFTRRGADALEAHDNAAVVAWASALAPGKVVVLFQPRLFVRRGDWQIRGDVDILRLERDGDGVLHVLIADMKSSTTAKVEHRLQVAFYLDMLNTLFAGAGLTHAPVDIGVIYRGPADGAAGLSPAAQTAIDHQRVDANRLLGVADALLEIVPDPDSYRDAINDLVLADQSLANRVRATDFAELPFHLTYKCDGCLYNEFCMRWAAEHDDLSLLPHLTAQEKSALQGTGVTTTQQVAALKELLSRPEGGDPPALVTPPEHAALVQRLAATWPVGPRLDELIHRARRYRRSKGDKIEALSYIPSKGYGSLPYSDAEHNPNLVRVYLDVQHDYLNDRIYLMGALITGCERGQDSPQRRRQVVELAESPPDTLEGEGALLVRFAQAVLRGLVEVAAPDEQGERRAPVHLIFFDRFAQRALLDGLARHLIRILEATPLYDFVTQLAAFDSSVLTYLDEEIRELKNYPMVCQSLPMVASYLKFDWNSPEPYRDLFRSRQFDYWSKFMLPPGGRDDEGRWYTGRARFSSQIPLEYAYAAWGELPPPMPGDPDPYDGFRAATLKLLAGFHARRLEAMERVAKDFTGNRQTVKTTFVLPDLAAFDGQAQTLAQALDEFLIIERHSDLAAWKSARLAPPERRVLAGETLIASYHEADQDPVVVAQNRDNLQREAEATAFLAANPGAQPDKEQRKKWQIEVSDLVVRLRIHCDNVDCSLEEALALTTLREGDGIIVMPRTTTDTRPDADRTPFTPTPKQMLYGMGATITRIAQHKNAAGLATAATVEVRFRERYAGPGTRGFAFSARKQALVDGENYTLDQDPDNWHGYHCLKAVDELLLGQPNTLYGRLTASTPDPADWPEAAAAGQRRFLMGLDALAAAGALHGFEPGKRGYIGEHGDAPLLLVQGPPGTGKSYSTAFAVIARIQGALAAGRSQRVIVSCKTHAATDVLLAGIAEVQEQLRGLRDQQPALFAQYFDARLVNVPLYRFDREPPAPGIRPLPKKSPGSKGVPRADKVIRDSGACIVGATPGGVYRLVQDIGKGLSGHAFCDCLVLDEASQMNLPEALMAALPLTAGAQIMVVGDHRQMPPIVKHDWQSERRRTFAEFRTYESVFDTVRALGPAVIQFTESFRLHQDMAEFLRQEIYQQDGIAYFSRRQDRLSAGPHSDPFIEAVLRQEATIVVVTHDEQRSMVRNDFERGLIGALLGVLSGPSYELDGEEGVGVVVPHRAQRAALQLDLARALEQAPTSNHPVPPMVDTVERFQGGERRVIVVGATESDPQYLLAAGDFLLDPRRLTVALSRAKQKIVLVASTSVFSLFSTDEETFANAQLWKRLLRRTCTHLLWSGSRDGRHVEVWGNHPA